MIAGWKLYITGLNVHSLFREVMRMASGQALLINSRVASVRSSSHSFISTVRDQLPAGQGVE